MPTPIIDRIEAVRLLADHQDTDEVNAFLDRVLARGDGAAIYENADLGHPDLGHKVILSFGGPDAQIENVEVPPLPCPNIIGNAVLGLAWRYWLIAYIPRRSA